MANFFFNFFASIIIISVFMTISVNNAVFAVLFLILAFFSTMCILFLLNIDYLALMFILIYVGAITILFLFVVMMLKIKINEKNTTKFISFINIIISCVIIYNIFCNTEILTIFLPTTTTSFEYHNWFSQLYFIDNIKMLGQVLFNVYYFYFVLAGFVLLVGMISAILLSKESNRTIRRYQLVYQQLSREVTNAVFLVH
nr:NADH dehydrogenase subunit 6 [Blastocystis sp. subtype 8]